MSHWFAEDGECCQNHDSDFPEQSRAGVAYHVPGIPTMMETLWALLGTQT